LGRLVVLGLLWPFGLDLLDLTTGLDKFSPLRDGPLALLVLLVYLVGATAYPFMVLIGWLFPYYGIAIETLLLN